MPTATLKYPEWRPDLSTNVDASNTTALEPYLSSCKGVRPREDYYELHPTPATAPAYAVPDQVLGAFVRTFPNSSVSPANLYPYVGTATQIYRDTGSTWLASTMPTIVTNIVSWVFCSTNLTTSGMLAASQPIPGETATFLKLLISSFGSGAITWTAVAGDDPPTAATVAMVGPFAVVGNTSSTVVHNLAYGIRWSTIDDPNDWPLPLTADALAKQSGAQVFPDRYGHVMHIAPLSELTALVFQQRAIHRMTYVGGDVVWQFDTLSTDLGAETLNGNIQVGGWVYFVNRLGFFRTNGQAIEPIGEDKVDRYFLANVDWTQPLLITAAFDDVRSLVYWGYADIARASSLIDNLLIYNYISKRFSYIDLAASSSNFEFFAPWGSGISIPFIPNGFDTAHKSRFFTSAITYAGLIRTGEDNLNPNGGIAFLHGVRPICTDISSALTVTLRSRMTLAATPSEITAVLNTRSGIHNGRSTGRYHAVTLTLPSASCSRIEGLQFDFEPAGML